MHILTKFLVIMAALLSVLLSGLTIAYTTNAQRLRDSVQAERDRATAAEAAMNESLSASSRERDALQRQISEVQMQLTQKNQTIAEMQGENARLLTDKKGLELAGARHGAQTDQFIAIVEQAQKLDQARAAETEDLRRKHLTAMQREINLLDRINDLTGQLDVALETNRSVQEQLVELRQELESARGGGTSIARTMGPAIKRAPVEFRATVQSVERDSSGQLLVGISAGLSDRLEPNMELNAIDRNGRSYLATMVLDRVDLNEAVARVTLQGTNARTVQVGDLVVASRAN